MTKCCHRWKIFAMSNVHLTKRCTKCGEQDGRDLTPAERYLWKQDFKQKLKHLDDLHKIGRSFDRTFKDLSGAYKYTGYDLMCRVEKWAKKYPTVNVCSCDDDYFMSSLLVFIPHETSTRYMGCTMICIPQNGKLPLEMFLYPGHAQGIIPVIRAIAKGKNTPRGIFQKIKP